MREVQKDNDSEKGEGKKLELKYVKCVSKLGQKMMSSRVEHIRTNSVFLLSFFRGISSKMVCLISN